MKKKLTHNLGFKILSLFLAVLLWLAVLNIDDPTITKEFSNIPITEVNGDQITEAGKAYSYTGGDTISVKVKGKTSVVNRLSSDDFLAVADLSTLSITGAVMVDVSCPRYSKSLEISPIGSSTVLKVEIEDLEEKSLNVKVVTNGKVTSGYYIAQGVATPNLVTVSGPASQVDRVTDAVVNVMVSTANTTDITTNATLQLLDKNGDEISSSTLTVSQNNIEVTVPIYRTKTVPVNFDVSGKVADGYEVVSAVYEPKEVTVAGRKDDLENLTSITLKDYDISGQSEMVEDSVVIAQNLAEELPDGIVFTDKDATIALVVDIQKIVQELFEVPLSKITLKGIDSAYTYTKSGTQTSDKSVSFSVSGIAGEVNALTLDKLTAVVDVTGYEEGEYDLPVAVTFDDDIQLEEEVIVHVTITGTEEE